LRTHGDIIAAIEIRGPGDLAASSVWRLAHALFPQGPGGRKFVTFSAYYDESGTHGGSPATALAGLVGDALECARFEREWRKVLKNHQLTHVRAKHLFHRQGQHKGWGERQIHRLWADLLYVFQEHKYLTVTKTVLKHDDYRNFYIGDGPLKKERLDSKYALCVRTCLHYHPVWLHDWYGEAYSEVSFILEAGHRNAGDAQRVFSEIKNDETLPWRTSLGSISFGTKQDFPILQAADLIAYWFYKTECAKMEEADPESVDESDEISELEEELVEGGLIVLDHVITPMDLAKLRQNFLVRRKKRRVFGSADAHLNLAKYRGWEGDHPEPMRLVNKITARDTGSLRLSGPVPRRLTKNWP
jgi:hypothetical protein